ncbi:MAG: DUF5013 domain-containing protein [Prevotellaceae bacterium]|nr:DUF5013 domain-containing protein [Candidatus Faecinaster equi]
MKKISLIISSLFVALLVMAQRPDHLNNALTMYFPPVFSQDGGSCGSAQFIGYILTYELNASRNTDASLPKNQYPTHFTWLTSYQNVDKEYTPINQGVPNVEVYGGRTYSKLFGNQDCADKDYGWMQGYDKWYSAAFNRTASYSCFSSTMTPEGREELKNWLWNHSGDNRFFSGGVAGIGAAMSPTEVPIPSTETNRAIGVVGMKYVGTWDKVFNHALTVCGYDDRIEFDLDGNGIAGEKSKDEVGAWIICNSWGDGYANKGFIYCPYKYSVGVEKTIAEWTPGHTVARFNYRPLRMMKIKMDYTRRSELYLMAGANQDTSATEPSSTIYFDQFRNTGDGQNSDPAPEVPMLGRWADGMHHEPMEFGYDMTDLTDLFDRTKPIKYWFIIKTSYKSPGIGNGHVYNLSIIDYEVDENGIEIPCEVKEVVPLQGGKQTMIAVVVPGKEVFPPRNVQLQGKQLTWQTPMPSSYKAEKYYIYKNDNLIDSISADKSSYAVNDENANYTLTTAYYYSGKRIMSAKSNNAKNEEILSGGDNTVLDMNNSGFTIPNVFTEKLTTATIEFWVKPNVISSNNNMIGDEKSFFINLSASGQLQVGWNKSESGASVSTTRVFQKDKWTHVAVVVNNSTLSLYVDGIQKKTLTSNKYVGIPAMGNLVFGSTTGNMNCSIDELRIWKGVRILTDIYGNKDDQIVNPGKMSNLLAYLRMDKIVDDGIEKLKDFSAGNHAILTNNKFTYEINNNLFTGSKLKQQTTINYDNNCYAGQPLLFAVNSPVTTSSWQWNVANTKEKTSTMPITYFTFTETGEQQVQLSITDIKGTKIDSTFTVNIVEAPAPKLDFAISSDKVATGERFSLVNHSSGIGYTYKWLVPGGRETEINAYNCTAILDEPGTYDVTLVATDGLGHQTTMSKKVTAEKSAPSIDFDVVKKSLVKGETTYVVDNSKQNPTSWKWDIESTKRHITINGQNSSFVPQHPGYYDVTLTATNEVGSNSLTKNKHLVVSNANPKTSLHFTGAGEMIKIPNPIKEKTSAITIEFWMSASRLDGSFNFESESGLFATSCDATGMVTVSCNGKVAKSEAGFIKNNTWHHYALTIKAGAVKFYRDGELFSTSASRLSLSIPALSGNFVFGNTSHTFNGFIDELRFWTKELTETNIKSLCNAPISNPVASAASDKLVFYYDFNQNIGNVIDRTGNGYEGVRVNFGPEGDAWNSAEGVFTLDFDDSQTIGDVTSMYLTNYKSPFRHLNKTVNRTNSSRFLALEQGTTASTWKLENEVNKNNILTGVHVDTEHSKNFTVETKWSSFASELTNHLAYQTVTLPAGYYTFGFIQGSSTQADNSIILATIGDKLCDNTTYETEALAWSKATTNRVGFVVEEETPVSLGLIYNMSGQKNFNISEFYLNRCDYELFEADGLTNIYDAVKSGKEVEFKAVDGGIRFALDEKKKVSIYTIDGCCIFNDNIQGVHILAFQPGTYIVNGIKLDVK